MMSDRFLICNVDDATRLVGESGSYVLEVRKDKVWVDQFYWYSLNDAIHGLIKYLCVTSLPKDTDKRRGMEALLALLQKIDDKTTNLVEKIEEAFRLDRVKTNGIDTGD